jgi:hypothetical protein
MSERHWPRSALATTALATTALALLGATTVAGCGGGSASSAGQASATETAGVAATTRHKAITADQLKGALLTKVGGASPATAAESGNCGALPDVQTSKQTMHGVKVKRQEAGHAGIPVRRPDPGLVRPWPSQTRAV